jgi:hypothetical protein
MVIKATAALAAIHVLAAGNAGAQRPGGETGRDRLIEITGDSAVIGAPTRWSLGTLLPPTRRTLEHARVDVRVWSPEVLFVWNSAIPFSLNDGALWAGRGRNLALTPVLSVTGAARGGILEVIVAPSLTYSENRPYQVIPDSTAGRSGYASRYHRPGPFSADLPVRFGDRHLLRLDPGYSALTVIVGGLSAGVTAATESWGPGLRNQLVLGGHAAGIPRITVGTAMPWRTRAGAMSARGFSGVLTESAFFDYDPGNDLRSVSGALLELRPAFDTLLTIGFARLVTRPMAGDDVPVLDVLARSLDALLLWEPIALPASQGDSVRQRSDQIMSLFARWLFPESGFEVYGEWARMDLPRRLNELFLAPHHTGGFTLGFQWAARSRAHRYMRFAGEVSYVEQSRVLGNRLAPDYYTGRATSQGFTQRGQVIGAAIGPGGSSQFLAIDYIAPRWQVGPYAGRIRWENDAMYRQAIPTLFMHDATVFGGIRGRHRNRLADVSTDVAFSYRYNYLFQNGIPTPGAFPFRTVDVRNVTIALALTPR